MSISEEILKFLKTDGKLSVAERLAALTPEQRIEVLGAIPPAALVEIEEDWGFWGRPAQQEPPGDWLNWIVLAGRGWGKTRCGAEWVQKNVNAGRYGRFHLVGPTASDVRDIMVEGPSGIEATSKRGNRARYMPTKRKLEWENGAVALCFSADEPERLRGEQCEAAWADELAAWRYEEAWRQLQLGLRLGPFPRTVVTTTPRPTPLIKRLAEDPRNFLTKGITYDNVSNLAEAFINEITQIYEGTRFGRQELYAEILEDNEAALWTRELISNTRVGGERGPLHAPSMYERIVVAVDPAASVGEDSDETGIIVAGLDRRNHAYVLHDSSGRLKPEAWAKKVVALYNQYEANTVIAEKNIGGDLVERNILVEDPLIPVKLVHASKNKITRAEPVATAYERGRVHHVGIFDKLEEQMCNYVPGERDSPDRLDALVWAMTELIVGKQVLTAVSMGENELGAESYWKVATEVPSVT